MRRRKWAIFLAASAVCAVLVWILASASNQVSPDGNIVKNWSFEEPSSGTPAGWTLEPRVANKGTASLVTEYAHSGRFSLKLSPNQNNQPPGMANNPFGLGQGWPAAPFRGKKLYVSAWMHAVGGATAVVGVYVLLKNGALIPTELKHGSSAPGPALHDDIAVVPDRSDVQALIVGCVVEGTTGSAYFDDVWVGTQPPPSQAAASVKSPEQEAQRELVGTVVINADQDIREIPPSLYGTNLVWIWDGNGVWDEKNRRLQADVLKLTRELKTPVFRFPGGIFADFYHWKDGIGPSESRRETPHMPGGPKSVHRFGTNEALSFAEQAGGKLMITVNVVTGTPEEAADWIRYVNGRGPGGDGKPRVEYWEVGNESYVTGDLPAQKAALLTPTQYSRRYLEFARVMRAADPAIKIGAIGDENFGTVAPRRYPNWTEEVLRTDAKDMDFLSLHNGYSPGIFIDKGWEVRTVYQAMLASPELIQQSLEEVSKKIGKLAPERSGKIKIAVTEWGPFFQAETNGRLLDHVKTLGSGLFVASTLMVLAKNPSVELANFFQLVDSLWMGWIGPRRETYLPKGPYFALQMFTSHMGNQVVRSSSTSPAYSSRAVGSVDAVAETPYLDVMATRSRDRRTLYVMVVNKNFDRSIRTQISLKGFRPGATGTAWTLNGTGIDAHTGTELFKAPGMKWPRQATAQPDPRFDHGGPGEVAITSALLKGVAAQFDYAFPPHSVTSLEIKSKE